MRTHFTRFLAIILVVCSLHSCNSKVGTTFKAVNELCTLYNSDDVNIKSYGYGSVVTGTISNAKLFNDLSNVTENERSILLEEYSKQGAQIIYNNMSTDEVPIDSVAIFLETTFSGKSFHGYKTTGWKRKK